jgi:hypothetical protein
MVHRPRIVTRAANLSGKALRRFVITAEKAAVWHDNRQTRQRQNFLRRAWVWNVLLGLVLADMILALFAHEPPGVIHATAGLGLIALACKIFHTAAVIKAKKRGEL